MFEEILFTPGPTKVPRKVLEALSKPVIHHRSKDYQEAFNLVRENLRKLFMTSQDVIVFASSGTGAMEAAVVNFFKTGDKVLVINGGKFGERWAKISKAFGLEVKEIKVEWGEAVNPDDVRKALEKDNIKGVFIQACETSTGVEHPVKEVGDVIRRDDILYVVDGITGIGVFEINMDEWGIDILVAGSQKALMLPPGLSMIAASEKAWARAEESDIPKFYFDMKKERKAQRDGESAFTPAVGLMMALKESIDMIMKEGLENTFARHKRLAGAMRAAVQALGLEIFAKRPAPGLTAIKVDRAEELRKTMRKMGAWVAGGQDHLKGKIIRIAHMGYYSEADIIYVTGILERALVETGHEMEVGAGLKAAVKFLGVKE